MIYFRLLNEGNADNHARVLGYILVRGRSVKNILGNTLVALALLTNFLLPAAAVQNTPLYTLPKFHRSVEQKQLKVAYPDKYPFPLVSIQFPADHSPTFVDEIAGLKLLKREKKEHVTQLVDEQVIKSTYLACQLYEYLKTCLPENSIVLVPTNLQTDGNGKVISFPINKPVPAVVQVDLFSYICLLRVQRPKVAMCQPDTFGEKALTGISMSALVDGKREIIAVDKSRPFPGYSPGFSIESFYNTQLGRHKEKSIKSKSKVRKIAIRPDFRFQPKDVESEAKELKPGNPAAKDQLRCYANVIIEALNKQDLEKIRPALLAEYIDDIAPDLAQSLTATTNSQTAEIQRKEKFFNYCLSAMREQLFVKESSSLADVIYNGDFGKQFRTAVNSEYQFEKKSLASQRRQVLAIALCGATAGAGLAAMAVAAPIAAFHMAMAGAAIAVAGHETTLQNKLSSDFKKTWGDSHAAQVSCLLTLDNDTIEVRGDGAEGFRKSMKEAYEKRFGTSATATVTGTI